MKIITVRAEHMTDWYTIERAEHEGIEKWVDTTVGTALYRSARLEPYSRVEGSSAEMIELAESVLAKQDAVFARCAVEVVERDGGVYFSSPRNSSRPTFVPMAHAIRWAKTTIKALRKGE